MPIRAHAANNMSPAGLRVTPSSPATIAAKNSRMPSFASSFSVKARGLLVTTAILQRAARSVRKPFHRAAEERGLRADDARVVRLERFHHLVDVRGIDAAHRERPLAPASARRGR